MTAAAWQAGTLFGVNELWIAVQAVAIGATLVSDNLREFCRVPELRVDN